MYLVAIWFNTAGPTYVYFRGEHYPDQTLRWDPTPKTKSTWVGSNWHNHVQGESNSSCTRWTQTFWGGMKWTDNLGWYPWGGANNYSQAGGPAPLVTIGDTIGGLSPTDWYNYRWDAPLPPPGE